MADVSEMQDAVGSLKQFNAAARKELKALQKQLKKIKKSSASKEANKVELLLRRRETIEKLRISNQEHEMLSAKVKRLRNELRNENHAKLVLSCQNMVVQYVKEIKREMNEGVGPGASTSKYHTSNTDRNIPLMDEKDTAFHAQELQLKLGDVMMDGSTSGYDKGEQRHSLESHQRGTELTGLEASTATTVETKADTPDGGGGGSGGGGGKESNPQAGAGHGQGDDAFHKELSTHDRWLKSRKHQLMELQNATQYDQNEKDGGGGGSPQKNAVSSYSVNVLYEEREGLEYKCQLAVLRGFTFQELVEEACAHWGLSATYTFLEDPNTGAIWPASALVETELPLDTGTPLLKLVFREHLTIAELIAQSHGHGDGHGDGHGTEDGGNGGGLGETKEEGRRGKKDALSGGGDELDEVDEDWDGLIEEVHNPSMFHPHQLEKHLHDTSKKDPNSYHIDPKFYVVRSSWLVRDFLVFLAWFVLFNVYLTSKRDVHHAFWLNQAFEKPLQESSFVVAREDYVPKLNEYGAVPTEVETTTYFSDESQSGKNNRYDSYRWYQQLNYHDIADASQWWMWVEGPLVDLIYGPANATSKHVPGYLREGTAQLLGKLRFRQLRVKPNRGCTVSYLAKSIYDNCYADFDQSRQDTTVFTLSSDTTGFTWSSGGGGKGQSTDLDGVWSTYPGDGFVVDFDYMDGTRASFLTEINRLRLDNWLDLKTRAVVVELTAYSPTHNLYLSTHMMLEQSSSGLWTTSSQTWTAKLDMCFGCDGTFVVEVLLYLVTVYIVFTEILQLASHCQHRQGLKSYCCNIWSLHQNLTLLLFVGSIVTRSVYIAESKEVVTALWNDNQPSPVQPDQRAKPNRGTQQNRGAMSGRKYYDLTEHMRLIDATTILEALAVLVAAMRFFMYMKRHSKMSQFTHVFVLAGTEIIFFSFMFAFTFFGFVLLGHNIYGAHLKPWSTVVKTVSTLIKMMVGNFDYEAMRHVDPIWTPFFFFFYIIFVFMILVNVFLAILNTSYTNVREEVSAEKKRLMRTKELRPKNGSQVSKVQRVVNFAKQVGGRKAFSTTGIYRRPDEVKRETEEKQKQEEMSSNPWVST